MSPSDAISPDLNPPAQPPQNLNPLDTTAFGAAETQASSTAAKIEPLASLVEVPRIQQDVDAPDLMPALKGYEKLFFKFFEERPEGKSRAFYLDEISEAAAKLGLDRRSMNAKALDELRVAWPNVELNERGHVIDPEKVGEHFAALYQILTKKLDFWVIGSVPQIEALEHEFSRTMRFAIKSVVEKGEAVMISIAKEPPKHIADEIQDVSKKQLHGLMSLWKNSEVRESLHVSAELRNYLEFGTVKVRTTAKDAACKAIVSKINTALEQYNSFEDKHWLRVVKGIALNEKQESLGKTLAVCVPIVAIIKASERYFPGALHLIGGILDDICAGIVPDVSQSLGNKKNSWSERIKEAGAVLAGGVATLPLAFAFAHYSTTLFSETAPLGMRMAGGMVFALACCAGTVGTSLGALYKSLRAIKAAGEDPRTAPGVEKLSRWEKTKLAFREAILDVPFRVGHTVIGVPFQLGLGAAAGAMKFFNAPLFIMVEGMAETVLGAVTALAYPKYAEKRKFSELRKAQVL